MVKFKLLHFNDEKVTYEYYPEGNTDRTPGIIVFDKTDLSILKFVPSNNDVYIHLPYDFLNNESENKCDSNNKSDKDNGYYIYAEHTISRMIELYNKENEFPNQGMSMWY